ncbi:hypothetical protein [Phenylobacterium sp.]|jgi:transposase-like protein|uniref:terminase small subunit-like protein n=1 Tax=Phenylobacterium sp. TaxID=1871053 RepID=UPI002E376ACA|nr:hypothetical protein [Phenylobacterium sp.]HEX4711471.1 hypothetical protein [Phenylobacterium sp.]
MADGDAAGVGRRRPFGAGESLFSDELGAQICARVAKGESVSAICREAGAPDPTTVRNWTLAHPQFADALACARRTARIARRLADRRAQGLRAARPRRTGWQNLSTYTREVGEAICTRLANGESLTAIGRDPAMPCYETMLHWVGRHPEFEDMYVTARQMQADYLFDEARDLGQGATPETVWVSRLQFDIIRWQTSRLAPRKYCERLVIDAEVAARKAAADPDAGGMTVIVKRFSDVTPEEEAAADATEARYEARGR